MIVYAILLAGTSSPCKLLLPIVLIHLHKVVIAVVLFAFLISVIISVQVIYIMIVRVMGPLSHRFVFNLCLLR